MNIIKCNECLNENNMIISSKDKNGEFYFFCKKCYSLYKVSVNKFGLTNVNRVVSEKNNEFSKEKILEVINLFESNKVHVSGLSIYDSKVFVYINKNTPNKDDDIAFKFFDNVLNKVLDNISDENLKEEILKIAKKKSRESYKDINKNSLENGQYLVETKLPFISKCIKIDSEENLKVFIESKPQDIPIKVFKVQEVLID